MSASAIAESNLTPAAERILATASALFYANGIHSVGVDRIAAESGVTKKTLYDRFGSKEQLVLTYLRRRESRWRAALAIELQNHPKPGIDRVLAVFDAADLWYTGRSTKGCSAVNARAEAGPEVSDQPVVQEVVDQKAWMLHSMYELCREAAIPEPTLTSQQLLLVLEGALVTLGTNAIANPMHVAKLAARALLLQHQHG